jgi:hypothetical protein
MEGLPVPGTIRWHVAHLEHCARHYVEILRNRPLAHEPATPSPGIADLVELINRLERARRLLREEIQRLMRWIWIPLARVEWMLASLYE